MRFRALLALVLLFVPSLARAQSSEGIAHLVSNLILKGITLPGASTPGNPHSGHFTLGDPNWKGDAQAGSRPDVAAIGAVEAFSDRMTSQFANVPLGSSTGGFTFDLDAPGGVQRGALSFGPAFAERALTIGRHKVSIGFSFQHTSFDTFGGLNLDDRSITFYLPHTDCCNAAAPPPSPLTPGFEGDLMEAALDLKATTDTAIMFANVGLTRHLDVGIAVPISHVTVDANIRATIIRLSSFASPTTHTFVDGQDVTENTFAETGTATGLGDVVLRAKYHFLSRRTADMAAAVDVRLPTGDEDNLLGLGTTQAKVYFILSSSGERFSPHVNVGFTISGKGNVEPGLVYTPLGVSDEFNYAAGVEFIAHKRVTIVGDILGQTLFDAGTVAPESKTYQFRPGAGSSSAVPLETSTVNPLTGNAYRQLALTSGNLNLPLATAGAKVNVARNLLFTGNVLFPLTNGGLRDRLTFAFGLDFAF